MTEPGNIFTSKDFPLNVLIHYADRGIKKCVVSGPGQEQIIVIKRGAKLWSTDIQPKIDPNLISCVVVLEVYGKKPKHSTFNTTEVFAKRTNDYTDENLPAHLVFLAGEVVATIVEYEDGPEVIPAYENLEDYHLEVIRYGHAPGACTGRMRLWKQVNDNYVQLNYSDRPREERPKDLTFFSKDAIPFTIRHVRNGATHGIKEGEYYFIDGADHMYNEKGLRTSANYDESSITYK